MNKDLNIELKKFRKIKLNISLTFFLIFTTIVSCQREKSIYEHEAHFKDYRRDFNEIIIYLNNKYNKPEKNQVAKRITFLNCLKYTPSILNERCDEVLSEKMTKLNIQSIELDRDNFWCNKSYYDRIYFMLDKEKYFPTVFYVYDFCLEGEKDYESKQAVEKNLEKNWMLLVEYK